MLEVTQRDRVFFLRVSAPARFDDSAATLICALNEACTQVQESDAPVVGVVVTSSDIAYCLMPPQSADDCDSVRDGWATVTNAIAGLRAPTIAAIDGDAVGPAWELALACDLRVAARHVRVGSPEIRWGRIPAAGGTQRLTRLVGSGVAARLLLLGEVLEASDAHALGLLHRVEPRERLGGSLDDLLAGLRDSAPIALAYAKEAVHSAGDLALADGLRLEADLAVLLQTTGDRAEGISAFLTRRAAHFQGR
jgi:enoyl-CoA hydratase